jgi:hypothetical protein
MGLAASVFVTSLLSTPLMVVQMALLQLVAGDQQGLPTIRYKTFLIFYNDALLKCRLCIRSLIAVLLIYTFAIAFGFYKRTQQSVRSVDVFYNNILYP